MPTASVIIATYNWSSVLPYSINSALNQSVEDIEVLVVGDCCTDDSEQVVRDIGDPRVRWFNLTERTGHQSGPNNYGLSKARAPVAFYLGHDDLWLPRHVELLLDAMASGPDIAYGLTIRVTPDEALSLVPRPRPYTLGTYLAPTGFAHRIGLVSSLGGWGDYQLLDVAPEVDLVLRFVSNGSTVKGVNRVTAIKLPASVRHDVYRTKPFAVQKAWLDRIREEPDLEARLLSQILIDYEDRLGPLPARQELKRFARTLSARVKKKVAQRIPVSERIDRNKRFKGSD